MTALKTRPRLHGCFVTGTDTGVGKTRVAAAILHRLANSGVLAAGFKPVAAGCRRVGAALINDDVRELSAASGVALTHDEVGPYCFEAACAPHIAAELEGRTIDFDTLVVAAHALARRTDALVVEGAGGFCVPLGDTHTLADLAAELALPVVLVVGLRLGCLNHALLTAEAIRARGLRLAGWVANCVDPGMSRIDANVAALRQRLSDRWQVPFLGMIPWLAEPDPATVAAHLDGLPAILRTLHCAERSA